MFEPIGKRRIRHAGRFSEVLVSAQAEPQVAQDQHRPTIAERIQHTSNRTRHSLKAFGPHRFPYYLDKTVIQPDLPSSLGPQNLRYGPPCRAVTLMIRVNISY